MIDKKIYIIFGILLILALYVGFTIGVSVTLREVAEVASGFIDPELIEEAVYRYKNHIKNAYPMPNPWNQTIS